MAKRENLEFREARQDGNTEGWLVVGTRVTRMPDLVGGGGGGGGGGRLSVRMQRLAIIVPYLVGGVYIE